MHTYSLFNMLDIFDCLGLFWLSFLSLPLFLFTLDVSMAPKRKSIPARNPLHSGASSSSDFASLSLRFHDDNAYKAFSENFSRRGIHVERQVVLSDFADIDLPSVIHSRGWESLVTSRSPIHLCLSRSFTPTCTRLIVQYLFSSLAFEVRTFLSHCNLLQMCFGSLG